MSRRRFSTRSRRSNRAVALTQIGIMALLLAGVLFFRDKISLGASIAFSALGSSDDLRPNTPPPETPPTPSPD
jgi:hypothetical protein